MLDRHLAALFLGLIAAAACSTVGAAPPAADLRLDPLRSDLPLSRDLAELSSIEDFEASGWDSGIYLEAYSHPVVQITADEDAKEPGGGFELEADLRTGDGYGVAAGVHVEGFGLGLLYLTSEHTERFTEVAADFHGAFVEARASGRHDFGWAAGSLGLGLGVGFGGVDFEDVFRDSGGTALEARLSAGLHLRHVGLEIGGGAFSWGEPGETVGTGTYLAAGITFWF